MGYWFFKTDRIYKEYAEERWEKRLAAKDKKIKPLADLEKLLGNSLYGRTGMRIFHKSLYVT